HQRRDARTDRDDHAAERREPTAPIDLLGAAGGGALKRVGPVAAGTALLLGLLIARRVIGRRTARPAP
ncbi:hypothetical protein ACFHW2_10565, partial [Actinomadura sp. LOL_016]|uniref:hypothetical protein n=1 Tax=Actinomadura sp. LOL_016 TaxID=3345411 RepID=UPI003A8C27E5